MKTLVTGIVYAPEPLWIDHVREALEECGTLLLDLFREAIMRHAEDVFEFVISRYRDIAAVGFEVNRSRNAKLCAERH
jgi:hypothetical protein